LLPIFFQVTRVLALMVSEVGLKEPPPPAIDMLALPVGMQPGWGLGLGLGEGLGLGDGLALGEGLGLGPWASVTFAPTLRKITPMVTTAHWIHRGCVTRRFCGERLDWAA
jgi:hypothetical protein